MNPRCPLYNLIVFECSCETDPFVKEQGTLRVIFGLFSEVNKFWSKYSLGHGLSIYSNIIFVSLIVFEIPGKKDDMQNYDVI